MNARLIDALVPYMDNEVPTRRSGVQLSQDLADRHTQNFIRRYTDTAVGWKFATSMAAQRRRLPLVFGRGDSWVAAAYFYCRDPKSCYNKHVAEAKALASSALSGAYHSLKAMLINPACELEVIAARTNIPLKTLQAFEKLFFNVIDRRNDSLYMKHILYPDSRLVELLDNYVDRESFENILLRIGFKTPLDQVLYYAGIADDSIIQKTAADPDILENFENYTLANGVLLAKSGLINQPLTGLRNARSLAVAKSQSDAGSETNPMIEASLAFGEQFKTLARSSYNLNS